MSPDQEYLRTTLRGSLLRTLATNERGIGRESYRLFEIGQAYLPRGRREQPEERTYVCGVLAGMRADRSWIGGNESTPDEMDFFDAKGLVESLLDAIGIRARYESAEDRILASGRTAHVLPESGDSPFGIIGEVHPDTLSALDIRAPRVVLYEIDLHAALQNRREADRTWQSVSRYPGVLRELSLLVDENATPLALSMTSSAASRPSCDQRWWMSIRARRCKMARNLLRSPWCGSRRRAR